MSQIEFSIEDAVRNDSDSRLVDNDSVSLAKEQLAVLTFRNDSMLPSIGVHLSFERGVYSIEL